MKLGMKAVAKVLETAMAWIKKPATQATTKAIEAAGGRKFFYGGWLIPIWVLATFLLQMPETLILAGAAGIGFAIGWEGAKDIRTAARTPPDVQDEAG